MIWVALCSCSQRLAFAVETKLQSNDAFDLNRVILPTIFISIIDRFFIIHIQRISGKRDTFTIKKKVNVMHQHIENFKTQ